MTYTKLLVLNVMIVGEIEEALDQHQLLGLKNIDLKTDWSGSLVELMTVENAERIARGASQRGLQIQCLSSCAGNLSVDDSDEHLAEQDARVAHLCQLVPTLNPSCVRLIAPRGDERVVSDARICSRYQSWCQQLLACGVEVVIENEIGGSIGRDPALVVQFFESINAGAQVGYIWDIANQWQEGRYPSVEDYATLKSIIAMLHVKGGRWDNEEQKMYAWKSQLASSDWPIEQICQLALADQVSAICINPPHGKNPEDFSYQLDTDINFMKNIMEHTHV